MDDQPEMPVARMVVILFTDSECPDTDLNHCTMEAYLFSETAKAHAFMETQPAWTRPHCQILNLRGGVDLVERL